MGLPFWAALLAVGAAGAAEKRYACHPDCDVHVSDTTKSADAPVAWSYWSAPGGIEVAYLDRPDVSGGGGMAFGMDVVRYVFDAFEDGCGEAEVARRCAEFCAGPSFIGFALLGLGACGSLVVLDVNPLSVAAARETVRRNDLGDRVSVYHSDGLDDVPASEKGSWDLVVSNPPHFVSVESWAGPAGGRRHWLNAMAVDADWGLHARFYRDASKFLSPTGHVVFQENKDGSRPETFLPLLPADLRIVAVADGHAAAKPYSYWYLHVTKDADSWTRDRKSVV